MLLAQLQDVPGVTQGSLCAVRDPTPLPEPVIVLPVASSSAVCAVRAVEDELVPHLVAVDDRAVLAVVGFRCHGVSPLWWLCDTSGRDRGCSVR